MAESKESSNPKTSGKWVSKAENNDDDDNKKEEVENSKEDNEEEVESEEEKEDEEEKEEDEKEEKKAKEPIDLTIQLTDSNGQKAALPLSQFSPLQRTIQVSYLKTDFITGEKESEKVFQTFYFPIQDFIKVNENFDGTSIEKIEFVFNKSKSGVVVIDNIGFMKGI